jgi:hypothetical protein
VLVWYCLPFGVGVEWLVFGVSGCTLLGPGGSGWSLFFWWLVFLSGLSWPVGLLGSGCRLVFWSGGAWSLVENCIVDASIGHAPFLWGVSGNFSV